MKEIGGYIELEHFDGPLLHEGAIALNCGRNALAYLLRARKIRRILAPDLICDSVPDTCRREGVAVEVYPVDETLRPPADLSPPEDAWVYLVNYYGQLGPDETAAYARRFGRVIADQAQSYFQPPLPGMDTLYTCRKYFGVADGAFLYTDALLEAPLPEDESRDRMGFLLGRFERDASSFYDGYRENNRGFASAPVKRMSRLTENLLRAVNYEKVQRIREENFRRLHAALGEKNGLKLSRTGTFAYPFRTPNGAALRAALQKRKIYVPTLWPDVLQKEEAGDAARRLAAEILPLPVDQRYGAAEMDEIILAITEETEGRL